MSSPRVVAPDLTAGVKLHGPASYFRSIEKSSLRPIQEWLDLVVERLDAGVAHLAVVGWLKEEHALGHGHAQALVAFVRGELSTS